MINTFKYNSITVDFEIPPMQNIVRGKALAANKTFQSDGSRVGYRYNESNKQSWNLTIAPLLLDKVEEMQRFFKNTVGGIGKEFTWYDHNSDNHTIILLSEFISNKLSSQHYSVMLRVEEQ